MAPAKVEDDPVVAEYDVYITPPVSEQVYLIQYPNRSRKMPYDRQHGAAPQEMRVKPNAGYIEADVKLNTQHNYNKYLGLKWGDAAKTSKEVHNISGTFGLASGLSQARSRARNSNVLKANDVKEEDYDRDLQDFRLAERDHKVLAKQTLGGQIIGGGGKTTHTRKSAQFVGAFQGDKLHLTPVTGVAQLRPQFHHLDAEAEQTRLFDTKTRQEIEGQPAVVARAVTQRATNQQERNTPEVRMRKMFTIAEQEHWIKMQYMDEVEDISYDAYRKRFYVQDVDEAVELKSEMDSEQYLDAITAPRHGSSTRRRKRPPKRKEDGTGAEVEVEEGAEDVEVGGEDAEMGEAPTTAPVTDASSAKA